MSGTGSTIGEPSTGPEAHSPEEQNDNEGLDQQIFDNLTVKETLDMIGELQEEESTYRCCSNQKCIKPTDSSFKTCMSCRESKKEWRRKR